MTRILIVDDDRAIGNLLEEHLRAQGHDVLLAYSGAEAIASARASQPDIVILDLELPDLGGIEVLERLKSWDPSLAVLILTGHADVRSAVRATELGAFAYLSKSPDLDELELALQRAFELHVLRREVASLRDRLDDAHELLLSMGHGRAVRRLAEEVKRVADSDMTVLLQGETGTGKELVARAIHDCSARRERPFVALDCGALPESLIESELFGHEKGAFTGAGERRVGHFQLAEGGTLFLDELGNLPLALQARLLRVLQERRLQPIGAAQPVPLDVRFVAATNIDLREASRQGRFRQDLFFRLAEYTIVLPALRDRAGDIDYLAQRFAGQASVELRKPAHTLTAAALELLRGHSWPGNVRELRNVVRRAVLQSEGLVVPSSVVRAVLGGGEPASPAAAAVSPLALGASRSSAAAAVEAELAAAPSSAAPLAPLPVRPARELPPLGELSLREISLRAAQEAERAAIQQALESTQGNKSEAARRLRTDYKTLHLKIRQYGLR